MVSPYLDIRMMIIP